MVWSVYVSVCCRVTSVSPAKKTTEQIKMTFGCGLVKPKEPSVHHSIRCGPDLTLEKTVWGKWQYLGILSRDVARILSLGGLKPMASAEREPITGVWGQSPQRGLGAEPLVWGQRGEALLMLKGF